MGKQPAKPLGHRAYGSIPHLPGSRTGPADYTISAGQAKICTERTRDKHDVVFVQEKLDGSNMSVALINGKILALGRAGYLAKTSPFEQHLLFESWVRYYESRFRAVLREGERLCGEWLAQAHGILYPCGPQLEPFVVFDLMRGQQRSTVQELADRVGDRFQLVRTLHSGPALPVAEALRLHEACKFGDVIEGVVYRVERNGEVDFLAKHVLADKVDGKYLPEISGGEAVWNWRPCGFSGSF